MFANWRKSGLKKKRRVPLKPTGEFPLENVEAVKLLADYIKSIWTLSAGGVTLGIILLIYTIKDFPAHAGYEAGLRGALAIVAMVAEIFLVASIIFSVLAQRHLINAVTVTSELNKSSNWSADNTGYEEKLQKEKKHFSDNYSRGRRSFFYAFIPIALIAVLLCITVIVEIYREKEKPKKSEFSIDANFKPFPFNSPTLR